MSVGVAYRTGVCTFHALLQGPCLLQVVVLLCQKILCGFAPARIVCQFFCLLYFEAHCRWLSGGGSWNHWLCDCSALTYSPLDYHLRIR